MLRTSFRQIAFAATIACVLLVSAMPAHAEIERTQNPENPDPSDRLIIEPPRIELDVQPGVRQVSTIALTNDTVESLDISVFTSDLGPSTDPRTVAVQVEDGEFGAGDWLEPEVRELRMAPFERVTFEMVIDPPANAPVGTNLGALIIRGAPAQGAIGTSDTEALVNIDGLIQVFLTVPGDIKHDVRITDIDVRDSYVFGSQRFAVWEVTIENRGTVNEHVSGPIDIRSIFGNSAHKVQVPDLIIIRGAKRTHRIVWNDPPWIGSFTPEARLRSDDAKLVSATGERITIFPWWIVAVVVLLIVLPALALWLRRRREWQLYLEDEHEWSETDQDPQELGR